MLAKTWALAQAEFSFLERQNKNAQHESKDLVRVGMNLDAVCLPALAKPKIWAMICHRVVANKTCELVLKLEGEEVQIYSSF